ncbi:predicted protein, partial [Nematostella vectensis]
DTQAFLSDIAREGTQSTQEKMLNDRVTAQDTQAFLSDIAREGTQSTQEKMLNDRVTAQLDAARGKLHDVFFKIPVTDRMAYIAHARSLAKERAIRQATKKSESRRLSAATMKAMQRRQDGTYPENYQ